MSALSQWSWRSATLTFSVVIVLLCGVVELAESHRRDELRRLSGRSPAAAATLLSGMAATQFEDCAHARDLPPVRLAFIRAIAAVEQAQTLPSERLIEWFIVQVAGATGVVARDVSAGAMQIKLSRWRDGAPTRPYGHILDACQTASVAVAHLAERSLKQPDDWRTAARAWHSAERSQELNAVLSRAVYAEVAAHLTHDLLWLAKNNAANHRIKNTHVNVTRQLKPLQSDASSTE